MFKNAISSFTNNISQRVKNPFLGTLMIVWIIRNWKFVYSLFNFDSKTTRESRLTIIEEFFKDYGFWEIMATIGYSLLILVVTYTFLNVSRLIINFFEKKITPKVYELTDKSSVVLRYDYEQIKAHVNELEARVEKERDLRLKTQKENDSLEARIKDLLSDSEPTISNTKEINPEFIGIEILRKLKRENKFKRFMDYSVNILHSEAIDKDEYSNEFISLGLMEPSGGSVHSNDGVQYNFSLTSLGSQLYNLGIQERIKNEEK